MRLVAAPNLPRRFDMGELIGHLTMLLAHRVDVLLVPQRPVSRLIVEQLYLLATLINDRRCRLHQFNGNHTVLTNPQDVQVARKR